MKKRCKSSGYVEWRIKARHQGKLEEWKPSDATTTMPENFETWVKDNAKKIAKMKNPPFFIRDNYQQGDVDKGLDTRITAAIEKAKLAAATAKAKAEEPKKAEPKPAPKPKAPSIPEPITDYDVEIQALRDQAVKYELNLAEIEALRASGKPKDKPALKKAIEEKQALINDRQGKWVTAQMNAATALAQLNESINHIPDGDKKNNLVSQSNELEQQKMEYAPTGSHTYTDAIAKLAEIETQTKKITKQTEPLRPNITEFVEKHSGYAVAAQSDDKELLKMVAEIDQLKASGNHGEATKKLAELKYLINIKDGYNPQKFIGAKDTATKQRLEDNGWKIIESSADIAAGFNLEKFGNEIEREFLKRGIALTTKKYEMGNYTTLEICGEDKDGQRIELKRTFTISNGKRIVHHDIFRLPTNQQGKGVSKFVFRNLYEQYQNAGVDQIQVHANIDVGGYTWARYGFKVEQRKDIEDLLDYRINAISPSEMQEARKIVKDFYLTNSDTTPFPMNLLTGYEWSLKLLKGASWYGNIDLNDKNQKKVLEKYLGINNQ